MNIVRWIGLIVLALGMVGSTTARAATPSKELTYRQSESLPTIVLVPGVLGSSIKKCSKDKPNECVVIWGDLTATALDSAQIFFHGKTSALAFESDAIYVAEAIESMGGVDVYGNLIKKLRNISTKGQALSVFGYDWRYPTAQSASNLHSFLCEIVRRRPDGKIYLLAHSMGGLVVKQWLRLYEHASCSEPASGQTRVMIPPQVAEVLYVGTPHLGAPKAIYAALEGVEDLAPKAPKLANRAVLLSLNKVGPSFASMYELFPVVTTQQCDATVPVLASFRSGVGPVFRTKENYDGIDALNPEVWEHFSLFEHVKKFSSVVNIERVVTEHLIAATKSICGRIEFSQRRLTQSGSRSPEHCGVSATSNPDVYYVFGISDRENTVGSITLDIEGENSVGVHFGRNVDGDGTVPAYSARNDVDARVGKASRIKETLPHVELANAGSVIYRAKEFIGEEEDRIEGRLETPCPAATQHLPKKASLDGAPNRLLSRQAALDVDFWDTQPGSALLRNSRDDVLRWAESGSSASPSVNIFDVDSRENAFLSVAIMIDREFDQASSLKAAATLSRYFYSIGEYSKALKSAQAALRRSGNHEVDFSDDGYASLTALAVAGWSAAFVDQMDVAEIQFEKLKRSSVAFVSDLGKQGLSALAAYRAGGLLDEPGGWLRKLKDGFLAIYNAKQVIANTERPPAGAPVSAPTSESVLAIVANPRNWAMQSGNYSGTRFSELKQITTENVSNLKVAWTFSTGVLRGHEGSPIVIGDTMYLHTAFPNNVFALNLNDENKIIWKYSPKQDPSVIPVMCCDVVNRGVQYAEGKILLYQADTTLVALNAVDGKEIWKSVNGVPRKGETGTSAPFVVKDKVIVGISGGEFGVRGHVTSYDLHSGKRLWRAYSVGPDDDILVDADRTMSLGKPVGKDSSLKTWNGDQWKIGGGSTWGYMAYDAELNLFYYGTGNPSTWNPAQRAGPDGKQIDQKWSMTMFARNPDTGVAVWAYQMTPFDEWDYDGVNEPILADLDIGGMKRKTAVHFDRNGFAYTWDRATGELLVAEKYDPKVNWATHVVMDPKDPQHGRPQVVPQYSPFLNGQDINTKDVCPAALGTKDQQPAAFSPVTGLFYVPTSHVCMDYEPFKVSYTAGQPYVGATLSMFPAPNSHGGMGNFIAWDATKGKIVWSKPEQFSVWSGALVTAGGVAFYGTLEGYLKAVDQKDGNELFKFRTPSGIIGNVFTYEHKGTQFVGVFSGVGGWAGTGLAAGLDSPTDGLGAVGNYALKMYTELGGSLTVFALR